MTDFAGFGLNSALVETLTRIEYTTPTPIQEKTIPLVLQGRDVLGTAQTGTGKTGAFAIPIIDFLLNSPRGAALIMTPTRELAAQVQSVLKQMLSGQTAVKTALLIGGEPMPKQLAQLRAKPRLIIGTPGRINDHLTRGSLMLHDAKMLVLDETDRMLDMGFGIQIDQILKFMAKDRQTLLFSATLPPEILRISKKYLNNPERIEIGAASRPALNIDHKMEHVTDAEKYPKLLNELEERTGSVIIFVKTKRGADKLAVKLRNASHEAEAIHGDLRQNQRDKVIKGFRNQRYRVLVATDVAARGLDIPHIEHVINYDLPQCAEDYIHRIGRTARAGAKGAALCYVSPAERGIWNAVNRLLNPDAKHASNDDYNEQRRGGSRGGSRNGGNRGQRGNDFAPRGGNNRKPFGERRDRRESFDDRPRKPRSDAGEVNGNSYDAPRRTGERKQFNDRPFGERRGENRGGNFERNDRPARRDDNRGASFERNDRPARRDENRGGNFERGNRAPRREDNRGERQYDRKPSRFEGEGQSTPNFIEKPYKERSFRADDQGIFKKKPEGSDFKRKAPQGDRKSSGNVNRFDSPRSSYFRSSDEVGSSTRGERKEKRGDSKSFNGKKPFGSKPRTINRPDGEKKTKDAA